MEIGLHHYLVLSIVLFTIGLMGLVVRRGLLVMFMCIEILLNSINLALVAISRYMQTMDGHVVVFFIMAVAAAEAAVGLAIVVALFRSRHTVNASDWRIMKG